MVDSSTAAGEWSSGDRYEPYIGRWSRLVAAEFVAWLDVAPGARWLDVGCGTGALTQAILGSASPAQVVGLDPSPAYIDYARKAVRAERARFQVGDAQSLNTVGESFDAVVAGLVLNFVPDRLDALIQMTRATRRGGVVAAYVWDYAGEMWLLRHFWDAVVDLDPIAAELHEGTRFPFCRRSDLEALLKDARLDDVESRGIVVPTRFTSFDDFWTPFLGGQGPAPFYLRSLDEARRTSLREALRARLPLAPDGSISMTARAWAVRGFAADAS